MSSNSSPSVAVVILNWNGKKFLEKFLPSVLASTYNNYRVIIADNASTDDSVPYLRSHYPEVGVIPNLKNEGFSIGYNNTLQQVSADYYILLNSDVEVTAGWMEPVIRLMESDASIGACQPKILDYNNREYFEYAGASGGWIDNWAYPFTRGRVFDFCEKDEGQYNDATQVFWASGAAFFVRSEVFHECKGFDPYFFAHKEEIDLCWRMQLRGYKVFVQPLSVVYHVGGGTLPMGSKHKIYLNFRNNLVMLSKNMPRQRALWKVPSRIFLDNVAALRALGTGDFVTFGGIVKAHWHYLGWLLFKRSSTPIKGIKLAKLACVFNGSVVLEYFIRKRRRFSEILRNNH